MPHLLCLERIGQLPTLVSQSSTTRKAGSAAAAAGEPDGEREALHLKFRRKELANQARRLLDLQCEKSSHEKVLIDGTRFIILDVASGGFLCAWVAPAEDAKKEEKWTLPAEFVRLAVGSGIRKIKFLPEGRSSRHELPRVFAYLYEDYENRTTIGIKDRHLNNEVQLSLHCTNREALRTDVDLGSGLADGALGHRACKGRALDFHWVVRQHSPSVMMIVVSTQAMYLLTYQNSVYKQVQQIQVPEGILNVWFDHSAAGYLVVESAEGELQSWKARNEKLERLPPLNMTLLSWQRVDRSEISLVQLYDSVFCCHCDYANGCVKMKDMDSTTAIELVILVAGPGFLQLQTNSNLLLVHRPDRAETRIFDIRNVDMALAEQRGESSSCRPVAVVREFCAPLRLSFEECSTLPAGRGLDDTQYPAEWRFSAARLLLDGSDGGVWRLRLNLAVAVAAAVPSNKPAEKVRWLLTRQEDVTQLMAVVAEAANSDDPSAWTTSAALLVSRLPKGDGLSECDLVNAIRQAAPQAQRRLAIVLLEALLRHRLLPGESCRALLLERLPAPLLRNLRRSRVI